MVNKKLDYFSMYRYTSLYNISLIIIAIARYFVVKDKLERLIVYFLRIRKTISINIIFYYYIIFFIDS